ncbi:MAG: glycosyltransferase family 2 protein [Bacteroidota bacterium]
MRVSIITVCLNNKETIETTICSVLNQIYSDIEYIIIDGQSTDGTMKIIEKYKSRISKIVSEKDEGMYFAINKGISLATGEVVGILNADDFFFNEEVISKIVNELEKKKTDSVYGNLQYVYRNNPKKIFRNWKSLPFDLKLFFRGWMPPHPTFFVKRKCYERFGNFNTSLSISADYELMLRFLYKYRISTSYIPEVLVKMRTGGLSNITLSNRIRANKEDRLAWKLNGLKPKAFTLVLKPLSKLRQFF